jgi:hypothetical protein
VTQFSFAHHTSAATSDRPEIFSEFSELSKAGTAVLGAMIAGAPHKLPFGVYR